MYNRYKNIILIGNETENGKRWGKENLYKRRE